MIINEWAIWGIPQGDKDETILVSSIKDESLITGYLNVLHEKHGCTKMRVQKIDDKFPDFKKTINGVKNEK